MTEQQADKIIELLTEIKNNIPSITKYNLEDIYLITAKVKESVDQVVISLNE